MTALITTISPVGIPRFGGAPAPDGDSRAFGSITGTTGAGAPRIIIVKSLGPAAPLTGGAPPRLESGVDDAFLKTGGGNTDGMFGGVEDRGDDIADSGAPVIAGGGEEPGGIANGGIGRIGPPKSGDSL